MPRLGPVPHAPLVLAAILLAAGCARRTPPPADPAEPGDSTAAGLIEARPGVDDPDALGFLDSWDLDADGMIDGEEFGNAFGDLSAYDSWDWDGSGGLDVAELRAMLPGPAIEPPGWDLDGDGVVDRSEAGRGLRARWDIDGDGRLDVAELREGVVRLWDVDLDGKLGEGELARGLRDWGVDEEGGGGR